MSLLMGQVSDAQCGTVPFPPGETFDYDIKKMGLKVGKASLVFDGLKEIDGRPVFLIVFTAEALNFFDEEKISVGPSDFLPVRVVRDLNIWGSKEKITEYYETAAGKIRIVKTAGGKTTEQVIEKKGKIENIYGFIFRYRKDGGFKPGDTVTMRLPTTDIVLELVKKQTIAAAGEKHEAYFMQSDPRKYKIWFGDGPAKLPLRIDGAAGVGNTSMILSKHFIESETRKTENTRNNR